MKKVFDQTVRDLKRGVNKKVLKVPGIEQKVLDATSNESWGPHGTLLADIAQATRNYHEYQMIMTVIWKRINDTGKNWRHVYKALTVLEYLVAHGSERVIDDIREHAYQISTLADFQYIDSSGRDQGSNVRKKSQSLVALVNDKERIIEVRQKAAANRDKFRNASAGGMYKPGSYSSSGGYGDRYDYDRNEGRYGGRDDDQNGYGYGREREYGYRDDDRYGRNGDSYGRDGDRYGRDYDDRYSRDGYRDDDYRGGSRNADGYQDGSSRNSDRNRASDDDGQASSRPLERKYSEQNIGAPPSYEEALSESRSPIPNDRDGEALEASVPKASSPPPAPRAASPPHAPSTSSPPGAPSSSPQGSQNPSQGTNLFDNSASRNQEVVASDEFDPRGPIPAVATMSTPAGPPTSNNTEVDLLGSLSDVFSSNALAIMPATSATTTAEADAFANGSVPTFSTQAASTVMNQSFEDPFGDSPFKAVPSTETTTSQQQTSASVSSFHPTANQNADIPQPAVPNAEAATDFGNNFYGTYPAPSASNVQPPSANSQFLAQELSTSQPHTDILADILPPTGPPHAVASQGGFSAPTGQPVQPSNNMYGAFHPQPGSMTPQPGSMTLVASTIAPQTPSGSVSHFGGGNFNPPAASTAPVPSYMAPQSPAGPPAQFNGGNFPSHQSSAVPATSQVAHQTPASSSTHQNGDLLNNILPQAGQNPSIASQSSLPSSTGALAIVPQSQPSNDKFEPKSAVWADTLSRGLVNFNISGPKINPLADIGVDFDAINRKEKRMERQPPQTAVTSTVTMGKAMGAGSGLGRAGAGAIRAPPNPMMGSSMGMGMGGGQGMGMGMGMGGGQGMGMGMGMSMGGGPGMGMAMGGGPGMGMAMGGPGMGMGGYGGMNQPMGMGMGMGMGMNAGMNMGMGQGGQMQPQTGMFPGSTMPGGYRPMMGTGGFSQQPYGGGYR